MAQNVWRGATSAMKYASMPGYCLWHRILAHVPNLLVNVTFHIEMEPQELESLIKTISARRLRCSTATVAIVLTFGGS